MLRRLIVLAIAIGLGASLQSADAGAKGGKIRWSYRKTGACKVLDPIAVPAAKNGKAGTVEIKITFEGGKLAEFALFGDGDTNLDVIVKDAAGNVVVKDVDPPAAQGGGSDICVCRWTPKETAEFTIVIRNEGEFANIAQAATN